MYGWMNKVLYVNLSTETIWEEKLPEGMYHTYIGGRGLGTKILYDRLKPGIDPLSEDNIVVIAVGPLTKTDVPTSGRMSLSTKSPLTNTIFDSNAGGYWGPMLKASGYDALIIQGASRKPVYLSINEEKVEIKEACSIWGKGTKETDEILAGKEGKRAQNLMIGQAGENLVRIASISVNAHRSLGRGGVGAVFGSKNLKAISVQGNRSPAIADQEKMDFINYEYKKWLKASPLTSEAMPTFGTSMLVNLINQAGALPTNNFQKTQFSFAEDISGEAMAHTILEKNTACYNCPIRCGRKTRTRKAGGHGPEYETVGLLGSNLGIKDLEAIAEMNYLCNDFGLDTISTGGVLSCLMEMVEKKYLEYPIQFGDAEKARELIQKIAFRDGLGDQLAEGAKIFASSLGHPELAMEVKGLVIPAYDPRAMKGRGLGYITSNRGACHLRGNMLGPELLGIPKMVDRFSSIGKSGLLINQQNFVAIIDSLVVCQFATFAVGEEFFARIYAAITGDEKSPQDLLDLGERIWNMERLFNLREGFTREDDRLPARFLQESASGPAAGQVFEQDTMLQEYYRSRGWDEFGIPTEAKLQELGLEGVDFNA